MYLMVRGAVHKSDRAQGGARSLMLVFTTYPRILKLYLYPDHVFLCVFVSWLRVLQN